MRSFELKSPRTLREAVGELPAERSPSGAQPMGGGQDLLTVLKDDIEQPEALVRLRGVEELSAAIDMDGGTLVIGALATIQSLADHAGVREGFTALAEAADSIASPQIRSQATVGGNLNQRPRCPYYRHPAVSCYKKGGSACLAEFGFNKYAAIFGGGPSYFSHPSDLAPVMLALDAIFVLVGPEGRRELAAREYYVGPEQALETETVRRPNEVLVEVRVPTLPAGMKSTYYKFKERASYDFGLAAAAVCAKVEGGVVSDARVVLGSVAPRPWPSPEAEKALVGQPASASTWDAAGAAAVANAEPLEHNGYKVHLVRGVLRRALERLV